MVSAARPPNSARFLLTTFGIVVIGVLAAVATDVAVTVLTPVKLAFILGGVALLIPTMVVKDPTGYWLFLLVLSIPFDISKLLSLWLVDPRTLVDLYGQPASGTTAVELYLTDVVLIAMLLPWLARICLRREKLYFPKIAYLFVFYLAWALLVSLINAESFYLAIFELCRQALYFLSFVYLINNVATRLQFRSAVWAVFLGLIIGAGTVIIFFELGIGTESSIFARLHDQAVTTISQGQAYKPGAKTSYNDNLTLYGTGRRFGPADREQGSEIKRSQGMFRHPAIPASLCGLTLPIVLAYLIVARTNRDRILFFMVFALGITALVLTFSRAGAIGLTVGTLVFFAVGGWSGLISRRVLIPGIVTLAMAFAVSIPLLLVYFGTRPGSFLMRFYLFEAALQGYSQHPILGVGLNNGTAAMKAGRQALIDIGIPMPRTESADSFYLVLLTEIGPLGFILFFLFFGKIVMIALRAMREVATDLKPLLVGIVAGLASLATQGLADDPLAGHAVSGTLWLFAALIVAIARHIQAETRSSPVGEHAALHRSLIAASDLRL
jgi:O-Antigen ligase